MEAKELRLGNLVFGPNGEITKIGYEAIRSMVVIDPTPNFNPISITEEWLERFGFRLAETDYDGYKILGNEGFYILTNGNDFRRCIYGCLLDMNPTIESFDKIEFVHDIQNLFYALKRKELTLK